jgi:hypothetical protein
VGERVAKALQLRGADRAGAKMRVYDVGIGVEAVLEFAFQRE